MIKGYESIKYIVYSDTTNLVTIRHFRSGKCTVKVKNLLTWETTLRETMPETVYHALRNVLFNLTDVTKDKMEVIAHFHRP